MENERKNKSLFSTTIIYGFIMHIILLWGVLDSNFHSPIITGLNSISMPNGAPAKRIFIFLADGLRYRTFKDYTPPYLKQVTLKQGVWGISNTRVPTESRPGNIAIAAGLYEDPSALFKGWKENPVNFDSIFNQSKVSWIWGSPDIVPLFLKYGNKSIYGESYPAEWQDFDNRNTDSIKRLDSWVFEQYYKWINEKAHHFVKEDKQIFYFHLLGCDTAGHAAKPYSRDYIENILNVDQGIRKTVEMTEKYFEANTTAYLLASDHGMTDWGSHGSGSTDETETPFVAWGAGISSDSRFHNIEQADLTPLIATLIGISVPVNNEGVLPYAIMDKAYENYTVRAFLSNVKQLSKQIKAIRELIIGKGLANIHEKDLKLNQKLFQAEQFIKKHQYQDTIIELKAAANFAKSSLNYYRRYQTNRYLFCLALMWIGWILFLLLDMSSIPRPSIEFGCFTWLIIPNTALVVVTIPLFLEYAITGFRAWRLFCYGMLAVLSLWFASRRLVKNILQTDFDSEKPLIEMTNIILLMMIIFIGLSYRWILSIGMLLTIMMQRTTLKTLHAYFVISGILLSVFPLLPVVEPKPRTYLIFITLILITLIAAFKERRMKPYLRAFENIRIGLTILVCINFIDGKTWASWYILFSTPIIIWCFPSEWKQRTFGINVALACPHALLSTSYETLFYFIFSIHLYYWPVSHYVEKRRTIKQYLNIRKLSIASYLMLYILLSFFGTGNMASISSFDPLWTRHFYTVFSPFKMAALILFKIAIPMILVGCLIRILTADFTLFATVLLLGDCLAIPLMYGVTSNGSWLDIGSAISRFVIAIVMPCILLIVYYLAQPFLKFDIVKFFTNIPSYVRKYRHKTHLV